MTTYTPPKTWTWDSPSGGQFASINRPIAGATHERALPVGAHPLQLYSLGTPNGIKVSVMLEELLAAGHAGAEYDAWRIDIGEGVTACLMRCACVREKNIRTFGTAAKTFPTHLAA